MFGHLLKNFMIRKNLKIQKVITESRFFTINSFFCDKISAKVNNQERTVNLTTENETNGTVKVLKFPFVWLRDNCRCQMCHHAASTSRILNWENFDLEVRPRNVTYDNQEEKLRIEWNDKNRHKSEFSYEWLQKRNFSKENKEKYLTKHYRPSKTLLGKENFMINLENFEFDRIINEDIELYNWLKCMITKGVAIITNVRESENQVRVLANRIAFIRRTHYGEEFIVKAKEGTSNVAYLSDHLQMHTDLPYYDYAPGVNLLHCLVQSQSKGAQNLLTDGFYIAQKMSEHHNKDFQILSKILVNWFDIGEENNIPFHSIHRAPVICLDLEGNIVRINHSIPQRDSFFSVSVNEAQLWYKALKKFVDLIHKEASELKIKEGTILCFDNSRLIHGRKKYEDSHTNRRHIIGAYLDWDEMFSRYRTLQEKFNF